MTLLGFTLHRRRYSARILLEREVAEAVAAEAKRRGVPVSLILREAVDRAFPPTK